MTIRPGSRPTHRSRTVLAKRRASIGAAGRSRTADLAAGGDGRDFDLIAVEAVDDRGAASSPALRAFFEDDVAPSVVITSPVPSALLAVSVPTTVTIHFKGTDPDGPTGEPVSYKYILLGDTSDFPILVAVANPDSLRRYYAPDFESWTSVANTPGVGGQVTLTDLVPGDDYLFVVVAFDAEGAYSPVFSLNSNMLRMRPIVAEVSGPRLHLNSDVISYAAAGGGLPGPVIDIEYPAGTPIRLRWYADPLPGTTSIEYRWALDPQDLDKELKRPRAGNDLQHWRPWSPDLEEATIGPFAGGETHTFVVEARDELGFRSRLTARIHSVERHYDADLLIVDDTRLVPDELATGSSCVRPPIGSWPTAAELDTFLFARGGVPWRCYPAGTMSSPGLFAGYRFDTLGTRTGAPDPTVPLATLGHYRHVIWIVDARSATYNNSANAPVQPMTALRYMSGPGRYNSLAAYIRGGGQAWLLGGGGAFATTIPWNRTANDGGGITWSNPEGELAPGRFMYDFAHWRSEIKVVTAQMFIQRFVGRDPSWPGVPDYGRLPIQMRLKSSARDPFPPGRSGQSGSVFYNSRVSAEFLSRPNYVFEGGESTLDSLYNMVTFELPPTTLRRIAMTYYHGHDNPPFMFTGFDIWSFTRADDQALVDFVLQNVWGLPKNAAAEQLVNAAPRR